MAIFIELFFVLVLIYMLLIAVHHIWWWSPADFFSSTFFFFFFFWEKYFQLSEVMFLNPRFLLIMSLWLSFGLLVLCKPSLNWVYWIHFSSLLSSSLFKWPVPLRLHWVSISWCPWCNGYRRRKWIRRHEFKSWTRLIAFHIALIPLGKVWIQLFSLQLWVNSRAD